MKKQVILNLIRYYSENNHDAFKQQALAIADEFEKNGDTELAEYIFLLFGLRPTVVPQSSVQSSCIYLYCDRPKTFSDAFLSLPAPILKDLFSVSNAVQRKMGAHKFIFYGSSGTGKSHCVQQLSDMLKRDVFRVNFSTLIAGRLDQTLFNITSFFEYLATLSIQNSIIILFDDIEKLFMDTQSDMSHEHALASTLSNCLQSLNEDIVLVATIKSSTGLIKPLLCNFDLSVDFDRYSRSDLLNIAQNLLCLYISQIEGAKNWRKIFNKIINLYENIPMPGELKHIIKSAIAFSDPDDASDFLRRLYYNVCNDHTPSIKKLHYQNFSLREIELLTSIPKSTVSRRLKTMAEDL